VAVCVPVITAVVVTVPVTTRVAVPVVASVAWPVCVAWAGGEACAWPRWKAMTVTSAAKNSAAAPEVNTRRESIATNSF
jgi:hypothetical protein